MRLESSREKTQEIVTKNAASGVGDTWPRIGEVDEATCEALRFENVANAILGADMKDACVVNVVAAQSSIGS